MRLAVNKDNPKPDHFVIEQFRGQRFTMNKSGKIWGTTSLLFQKNNVEVHRITGESGGKSSIHTHQTKYSLIFVEKGRIAIHIEKADYPLTDITELIAGESTTIKPGEFHHFEILEAGTICYEIYWVELDPNDIVRRNSGSIGNESKTPSHSAILRR